MTLRKYCPRWHRSLSCTWMCLPTGVWFAPGHSISQRPLQHLDMSTLQGPELHRNLSGNRNLPDLWLIYITEACSALQCTTVEACPCMYYIVLYCTSRGPWASPGRVWTSVACNALKLIYIIENFAALDVSTNCCLSFTCTYLHYRVLCCT